MDPMLKLIRYLSDIEDPEPQKGAPWEPWDPDTDAAHDAWQDEAQKRYDNIDALDEVGMLPATPRDAVERALATAAQRVAEAEQTRDALAAIAVHGEHLPVRRVADLAKMHHKTTDKRVNDPRHHAAVLRYKEFEVESWRARATNEGDPK